MRASVIALLVLAASGCKNTHLVVGNDSAVGFQGCDLTFAEFNTGAALDPTGWTDRVTNTFDDSGHMLTSQDLANVGADGTVAWASTWTYDGNGEMATQDYVSPDREDLWTYTWDSAGNPLTQSIDEGADGLVNYVSTWTYTSHEKVSSYVYTNDRGAESTPNSTTTYAYNSQNLLAALAEDVYSDGTIDTRWKYTYDPEGHITLAEWDGGADGTVNESIAYTTDGHGNILTAADDLHADGSVDVMTTNTWDTNDDQLSEQIADHAGTVSESDLWTYDSEGNVLSEAQDLATSGGVDGTVDATAAYTWVCVNSG